MTEWVAPAIIATLTATAVLTASYAYLYFADRERYMGIWAAGWAVYALRFAFDLVALGNVLSEEASLASQVATLASGVLLLWGTFVFTGRRFPRWLGPVAAVIVAWTAWAAGGGLGSLGLSADETFALGTAPNFVFVGAVFVWTGVAWLRAADVQRMGRVWTGWIFILWGVHKWDYPVLRQAEWAAAPGYLLSFALTIGAAMAIVLVHFRRAIRQLRESRERYESLFEAGHAMMLVFDPQTRRIVDANAAAATFYGYSREQMRSMSIDDLETMEPEALAADLARALDRRSTGAFQHRHRTAAGEVCVVEVYSGVQTLDGRDVIVGILHDVTDAAETRVALRESEERYTALFEGNRMMLLIVEPESLRIVQANPAAQRFYGWAPGDLEARTLDDVGGDAAGVTRERIIQALGDDAPIFEAKHRRSDGVLRDVEVQISPMTAGGRTLLSLMVSDVTERNEAYADLRRYRDNLEKIVEARTAELQKANRELAEASRAKSQFLANMSHELRTPLNSIIGFTGILLQGLSGPLEEEQRRQIGMVYNSGKHLLELISAVLDLSKIEAGRVSLEVGEFDACDLVRSVTESLRPLAEGRGLELSVVSSEESIPVKTDEMRLRQIALNLIGNAIKFTVEGSVTVTLSCTEREFSIAVTDTGSGIAKEDLPHVFEEFRQLDPTTTDEAKIPGTGLGLPVSRRLAQLLGGSIFAESAVGIGSTFTATVLRTPFDADSDVTLLDTPSPSARRIGRTVLLVDDDPSIHDLFGLYLRSEGVRLLHAYDLDTAMRLLRRQAISMIILDLEFEDGSGWSLLERVREDSSWDDLPILLCSAMDERPRAMRRGAFSYLQKPVGREELVHEVRRALGTRRTPE